MEIITEKSKIVQKPDLDITIEMQDAFLEVGRSLIFTTPQKFPLSRENAREISQQIQQEFIDGFDRKYWEMSTEPRILIGLMGDKEVFKIGETEKLLQFENSEKFSDLHSEFSPKKKIEHVLGYLWMQSHNDDTWKAQMYEGVGMTPKLAFSKDAGAALCGMNCFGYNIFIGSLVKKMGLPTMFGFAPDHPFTFVEIDGNSYVIDGQKSMYGVKRSKGEVEEYENYFIYYPRNKKEQCISQVIFVHNFDDSVLHEILENLEALKQAALGNESVLLPSLRKGTLELANNNRDALIRGDWRKMQEILFPTICKSLVIHRRKWQREVVKVRKKREKWFIEERARERFLLILLIAKISADIEELSIGNSFRLINKLSSSESRRAVTEHFETGVWTGVGVPELMEKFFVSFNKNLLTLDDTEVREWIWKRMKKAIIDRKRRK